MKALDHASPVRNSQSWKERTAHTVVVCAPHVDLTTLSELGRHDLHPPLPWHCSVLVLPIPIGSFLYSKCLLFTELWVSSQSLGSPAVRNSSYIYLRWNKEGISGERNVLGSSESGGQCLGIGLEGGGWARGRPGLVTQLDCHKQARLPGRVKETGGWRDGSAHLRPWGRGSGPLHWWVAPLPPAAQGLQLRLLPVSPAPLNC